MSPLKNFVKWEFGKVVELFEYLKYEPYGNMLVSRQALFYTVATLMKNIHICVNAGQSSNYFDVGPPTLDEYMDEIRP